MNDFTIPNPEPLSSHPDAAHVDDVRDGAVVPSQGCGCSAAGTSAAPQLPAYVYALGQIDARFPTVSLEKEYLQAVARASMAGLSDRQVLQACLSQRENRYIARQLCWVLTVQGMDTYLLVPRDAGDVDILVNALVPGKTPLINAVIGTRGPSAIPGYCSSLSLPMVVVDQIYTFDRPSFAAAVPKPPAITAEAFGPAVDELFDRVLQLTDNAGSTDEHRALNYLTMRYPAIYSKVAEEHAANCSLDSVESRVSRLSGTRTVIDVILQFTDRAVGVQKKFFVRVDATEEFPFIVTKLSPYFDR